MSIHGSSYAPIFYLIMSCDLYNFITYADPMVTAPSGECFGNYFMGINRGHVEVLYDLRITKIALQIIKLQLDKHGHFAIEMA